MPEQKNTETIIILFMEIEEKITAAASIAYSTRATIDNTFALSKEMLHKEGCFVECGVGAGSQIMAMQLAVEGTKKVIYAFDSFEGIPMAGEHDTSQPGIGEIKHNKFLPLKERLVSSGITCHSSKNVKDNFERFGIPLTNILFIEGWFQDTLPLYETGPIALLRLDGDLYESTMVCLEHLYPLVVDGGCIIVDDFSLDGAKKAVQDYFNGVLPEMITVDGGQGPAYFYKK